MGVARRMSSKTTVGFLNWSRAVAARDVSRIRVVLPTADRVPPLIFRATTGPRRLRSAAILVCGTAGSATNTKRSWM